MSSKAIETIGEVDCYIHYHDYNKQFPTLVVRGDFGIGGYRVNIDTGELTSVCICDSDNECCCNYNPS